MEAHAFGVLATVICAAASAVPVVYNYVGTSTYVRDGNCGDTKTPPLKYYDLDEKHKISRVISASSFQ